MGPATGTYATYRNVRFISSEKTEELSGEGAAQKSHISRVETATGSGSVADANELFWGTGVGWMIARWIPASRL